MNFAEEVRTMNIVEEVRMMNFAEDSPLNHSTQFTLFSINARMKKRKLITHHNCP